MHKEDYSYIHFTSKSHLDKTINSLLGIIEGIVIDKEISDREIDFLNEWVSENDEVRFYHPFNEIIPVLEEAIEDRIITDDEKLDISWVCERLVSEEYHNRITVDLQRLHAIMGGIIADGIVTEDELRGLSEWLYEHKYLMRSYPYDEVNSIITKIMQDHKIDEEEQLLLRKFFSEFSQISDDKIIKQSLVENDSEITGLCAINPEIKFEGSTFCFTGASQKYTRKQFADFVNQLGGNFTNNITQNVDYLVVGGDGNPCWAYACYGRKVEKAIDLRKKGCELMIVHEYDFNVAVEGTF